MTTRHELRRASHKSLGALLFTAILVACANGGALDDTSGDSTGTDGDSGVGLSGDAADEGSSQQQRDGGGQPQSDSGGTFSHDSGNPPPDDAAPGQDAAPPPQDAAPPPIDAAPPPPQDAAPPPPQDSGPVCSPPSGNPCVLVAPQCGCAANQKCDINPSNAHVDVCVTSSSSGTQGALCTQYPDCSPGFACIQYDAFGDTECEAWCVIGGPNVCTGGTTCKTLGTTITLGGKNYGTCQ